MKTSQLMILAGILFTSLVLTGCPHKGAPIRNTDSIPLTSSQNTDIDKIAGAIRRAGAGLGWQMKKASPGHIIGTLYLRKHIAIVDITFDNKTFNIRYKGSTNLDYESTDNTIHSNYNGWVQNLENAIMTQTDNL